MKHDWQLKRLHKLIMTSQAYRQVSKRNAEQDKIDPDNRLLGRMNVRRMEAETIRDAMLALSGQVSFKLGGKPVPVMEELERTFCAPVIESYGMTEATHQMTSNPLPPQERRPGCVGVAAGPEVKIMDTHGKLLGPDKIGEVVIRGDNVTRGYENNDSANIISFNDGWFRTGDQGKMDSSGYLTLTGRLKEIINRGGEKISLMVQF